MGVEAPPKDIKKTILTAAARLFAERGYQATPTRAIAEAVGIAQSTLWYHFRSKEIILLQMYMEAGTALLEGLERIRESEATPLEKLRLALEHHVSCLSKFSDVLSITQVELRRLSSRNREEVVRPRNRHIEILTGFVKEAIATGDLRPLDPRLLAVAVIGLPNWIYQRVGTGGLSTQQMTTFFWDLIYAGARANGGTTTEPAAEGQQRK